MTSLTSVKPKFKLMSSGKRVKIVEMLRCITTSNRLLDVTCNVNKVLVEYVGH